MYCIADLAFESCPVLHFVVVLTLWLLFVLLTHDVINESGAYLVAVRLILDSETSCLF